MTVTILALLFMSLLLTIIYDKSKKIIMGYADQLVESSITSSKHEIETWTVNILSGLNQIKNTIEHVEMSDVELLEYLKTTIDRNESFPDGVYVGFENNNMFDPSGWVPPADYNVSERDWFLEGLNNTESFSFGSTYLDQQTNEYVLSATSKLASEGNEDRVAGADISLKTISEFVSSKSILNTGSMMLIDTLSGKIIAVGQSDLINTEFSVRNENELIQSIVSSVDLNKDDVVNVSSEGISYSVCVQSIDHTSWRLVGYVSHDEVLDELYGLQKFIIILYCFLMLIQIILLERIIYNIIKPIKTLNHAIQRITDGDFSVEVNVKGNDEIAQMSGSMKRFIEKMREIIQQIQEVSSHLGRKAESSKEIARDLFLSSETQSNSMKELNQTVDEIARAISEVAESSTELSSVVAETGKKGKTASEKMKNTVEISEKGKNDMAHLTQSMDHVDSIMKDLKESVEEVNTSSEKIREIVKIIGDIANRTNLLALNAAIEAARAGEAGRGFSVVADEIRQLAETSQNSVKNIAELTNHINSLVGNTINQTRKSTETIQDSLSLVKATEDTFDCIYDTINETNVIVQDMIQNVNKVNDVAAEVAAITEEQSAASEEILATSENLANHANRITEDSYVVEKDAIELAESTETMNQQISFFKR